MDSITLPVTVPASLASFFGILARQGRVSAASMQWVVGDAFWRILHGSGTCSGTGALVCAHLSAGKKYIEIETERVTRTVEGCFVRSIQVRCTPTG